MKKYFPWVVIFSLAFVMRAAYLINAQSVYPFFSHFVGDVASYDGWARQIAGNRLAKPS